MNRPAVTFLTFSFAQFATPSHAQFPPMPPEQRGSIEAKALTTLQEGGTRFRGFYTKGKFDYDELYGKLKTHIENTIKFIEEIIQKEKMTSKNKELTVSDAVKNQLRQNYQVKEAQGLEGLSDMEKHERMMGQGNLKAALED